MINKLDRLQRQMVQDLGREPTREELALEFDVATSQDLIGIDQEPRSRVWAMIG